MLTILHAADLHLDSPFRSLPSQQARLRRQDQRKALEYLRDLALTHKADLVLLAGDLFDSQQVYPETLEALGAALGGMPCPVVIAPGNHDYYSPHSPYVTFSWPENVRIFQSESVSSFSFPELGVTVYGCAFTAPFRDDDPLAGFTAPRDGTVAIGCFHGEVGGKGGQYAPIAPESLAQSGLAYVALGHVHAAQAHTDLPTPWAYSGCPQGRGFDELGDKGALLLRLENGQVGGKLCPFPGPRYWDLSLPAGEDANHTLRTALADQSGDYVRLTLTGESRPLDLPTLQALGDSLCAVFQLRDETVPPLDLWARAEEDTLTGHFLREMKERLAAAGEEEAPLVRNALRWGLAALEGRESPQ